MINAQEGIQKSFYLSPLQIILGKTYLTYLKVNIDQMQKNVLMLLFSFLIIYNISLMDKEIAKNYNAFTTAKGNVVWVGTMNLAWKDLSATYAQDKHLQFSTQHPEALKIIHNFNHGLFDKKQIDQKSTYLKTGKGTATQNLINKEVKDKFPNFSFPPLNYPMGQSDIISFAYLFKQLSFAAKFQSKKNGFNFNQKEVESFYAQGQEQKSQIIVNTCKDKDNFMLSIPDKGGKEIIYFLKTTQDKTVDEVIHQTCSLQGKGMAMKKKDKFQMPVIELDCSRDYNEMLGLKFNNQQLKDITLAVMKEALKLKIDESGAKVQSEAIMMGITCIDMDQPRHFILDKTFWIVMKQVGKHPYLCTQIREPKDV